MTSATELYDISTRLAVGGAGLVYKATERASGRTVALKLLLPEAEIGYPLDMEALLRDAPDISLMNGENIVQLLDAFQDEDGAVLVYEFAEGIRGPDVPGTCPIPAAEAVDVAAQLLEALHCGEQYQYPHGDLKPSDITLGRSADGRPVLMVLDWGLANYRKEPTPGALASTAPERLAGSPPSHVADLFSAGAVLHYLFTGQQLVEATTKEEFAAAWQTLNPMALRSLRPDIPAALVKWVAHLLQPDPSQRPPSAAAALHALAALHLRPPSSVPSGTGHRPPRPQTQPQPVQRVAAQRPAVSGSARREAPRVQRRKKRSSAVFVTGFILLALGSGGFVFWKNTQTGRKPGLASAPVASKPAPPQATPRAAAQEPPPISPAPSATPAAMVTAAPSAPVATRPPAPAAAPAPPPAAPVTAGDSHLTFSSSAEPPVVDSADIANFAAQTGTDKWFFESKNEASGADAAKGQTFTTGNAPVLFKALTYKIDSGSRKSASPGSPTTWTIRLGTLSGNRFTEIITEKAQQTADTGAGDYITWTFTTPVPLAANTTYAVDAAMRSRTAWNTGIPYLAISGNVTTQGVGVHYNSGDHGTGGSSIAPSASIDRVFHVDLQAQ